MGQSMCDIWHTKWNLSGFHSEYLNFPLSLSFHQCPILRFSHLQRILHTVTENMRKGSTVRFLVKRKWQISASICPKTLGSWDRLRRQTRWHTSHTIKRVFRCPEATPRTAELSCHRMTTEYTHDEYCDILWTLGACNSRASAYVVPTRFVFLVDVTQALTCFNDWNTASVRQC
jgi:hypothetical protein